VPSHVFVWSQRLELSEILSPQLCVPFFPLRKFFQSLIVFHELFPDFYDEPPLFPFSRHCFFNLTLSLFGRARRLRSSCMASVYPANSLVFLCFLRFYASEIFLFLCDPIGHLPSNIIFFLRGPFACPYPNILLFIWLSSSHKNGPSPLT